MAENTCFSLVSKSPDIQPNKSESESADYSTLPDLPILKIFQQIPLPELMTTVPLISSRWLSLQPEALASKRHLILYIGKKRDPIYAPGGEPLFPDHSSATESIRLDLTSLPDQMTTKLITSMPNISTLQIGINCRYSYYLPPCRASSVILSQVTRLLEGWSSTLQTLKIHCRFDFFSDSNEIALALYAVITVVNTLPALEHLHLDFHNLDLQVGSLDLPILSRLKEFHFDSFNDASVLYKSLKMYAEPNERLQTINIKNFACWKKLLEHFGSSALRHRFVGLAFMFTFSQPDDDDPDEEQLRLQSTFMRTFPKLQSFSAPTIWNLSESTLTRIQQLLSLLDNLQNVTLNINDDDNNNNPVNQPQFIISSLPSVKQLTIFVLKCVNHTKLSFPWSQLFPSLQIIYFKHRTDVTTYPCQLCCSSSDDNYHHHLSKLNCTKKLLKPFKGCPELKRIYYQCDLDSKLEFTKDDL